MSFQLKKAQRSRAKLRIGLASPSGGGKTYSALLLAKGLVGDLSKVAVIDTEQGSASLYDHLGEFNVIELAPPFTPERYIEAMKTCEDAGMECIVIDSMTHEWSGPGGLLEFHGKLPGNSWSNWAKVTPRHKAFIDKIITCKVHVIGTVRKKSEWLIEDNDRGKKEPRKVGLADEQRSGLEYEWTVSFTLTQNHLAVAEKDRTGLFMDKPEFVVTEATGKRLADWVNSAPEATPQKAPEEKPKPLFNKDKPEHIAGLKGVYETREYPDGYFQPLCEFLHGKPYSNQNIDDAMLIILAESQDGVPH